MKLALPALPAASLAVTVTLYGPCCVNVETTVPVISPVVGAMLRPSGRPVAVIAERDVVGVGCLDLQADRIPFGARLRPGLVTTGGVVSPTFRVTVATLPPFRPS